MADDGENIRDQAEADRNMAAAADTLPALWKRMYDNLRGTGFDNSQAMTILKTFIKAMFQKGTE